ncbi:hypothetical protein [Massilia sp. WF1]|uniref:hypothetical protein n=1 Tax=Massilia sp. WF1 TaxID=1406431 RepID=UPI001E34D553|nr:hypothetical protein [Massilia sp. WF1]
MHQRVFSTHTADRQRRLQDAGTSLVSAGRALAVSGFMLAAFAPSAFAQAEATMQSPSSDGVDKLLVVWFVLTGLTMAYLAWDLFTRTPAMKVMKWGWLLVAVYTGPVAFIVYWFSCREPEPGKIRVAAVEADRGFNHPLYGRRRDRRHHRGGPHESAAYADVAGLPG